MGIKEDDFIKMLDAYMSGDGRSIKPQVDENGEISFFTATDNVVSNAAKQYEAGAESKLFSDDVDDDCPTCANIPNTFDNDFDDEW